MASTDDPIMVEAQAPPQTVDFLAVDGEQIAVRHRPGKQPAIFWLSGYRSDMLGTKAQALDQWTAQRGLAFTRHDYSGHGESSGLYQESSISKWLAQSMAVFRRYALPTGRRHILVGSSMGAWIALRMVQELNGGKKAATAEQPGTPPPIAGLLLLAPAPDFTAELMEPELSAAERQQLQTEGFYEEKSEYFPENPCIWTRHFFEDARQHNSVLSRPLEPGCPVHIVHGLRDREVPVKLVDKLEAQLPAADDGSVQRTTVPEGDHRLSREEDIELILRCLDGLVQKATAMDG